MQGNTQTIKHFTSALTDLFPIFKIIQSGEVNLKLKGTENVDKLFSKLGIS